MGHPWGFTTEAEAEAGLLLPHPWSLLRDRRRARTTGSCAQTCTPSAVCAESGPAVAFSGFLACWGSELDWRSRLACVRRRGGAFPPPPRMRPRRRLPRRRRRARGPPRRAARVGLAVRRAARRARVAGGLPRRGLRRLAALPPAVTEAPAPTPWSRHSPGDGGTWTAQRERDTRDFGFGVAANSAHIFANNIMWRSSRG